MKRDTWDNAASARLQQHLMRGTMKGRDYAPDQTYELSKRAQVGPVSAAVSKIMQQHADLWAADMREAHAAGLDVDEGAQWAANMREADAAVDRYLAAHVRAA